MKNIFKDNDYFNQNIMENDNFKYWFELLTSSVNLEKVNNLIAPVLYESDNNCFDISNSMYSINVENHDLLVYENKETPINCGSINISIANHISEEELKISYYKKNKNLIVKKIIGASSFNVNGIENENGIVYVDTKTNQNQISFPYRRALRKTSK